MSKTVVIDCFPDSASKYRAGHAIVAVDVIRATTMAVTAVALGRRCYPVTSVAQALALSRQLPHPILAGELGGDVPSGFDMSNSPAELVERTDVHRPIILLSSSGTQLIAQAHGADGVYLSCFRNLSATARYLRARHSHIAIIGAGSRGEFREEDQMGCAWLAEELIDSGYRALDSRTREVIETWTGTSPNACAHGNSAKYLKNSGQLRDLDFILEKIDDIDAAMIFDGSEVMGIPAPRVVVAHAAQLSLAQPPLYDAP